VCRMINAACMYVFIRDCSLSQLNVDVSLCSLLVLKNPYCTFSDESYGCRIA